MVNQSQNIANIHFYKQCYLCSKLALDIGKKSQFKECNLFTMTFESKNCLFIH